MTTITAPLTGPPAETARARTSASLGMAIFVGAWSMAFATIFLSYLILRNAQPMWPPEGVVLPSFAVAALGTLVLLASSVAAQRALRLARRGGPGFAASWSAALVLGLAFASLQTWLWADLWSTGHTADVGIYESMFYGLTWFHAAHVVCGLIGLIWVALGIARGRYGPQRLIVPASVATFWHFVDVVWVVLFVTFFIL